MDEMEKQAGDLSSENTSAINIGRMLSDLTRFPSDAHLVSWAGVCLGNCESTGKRKCGFAPQRLICPEWGKQQQTALSGQWRMCHSGQACSLFFSQLVRAELVDTCDLHLFQQRCKDPQLGKGIFIGGENVLPICSPIAERHRRGANMQWL